MTDCSPANSPLVAPREQGEKGQPDDEGPLANMFFGDKLRLTR